MKDRRFVYDTGMLIAIERRDGVALEQHQDFLSDGIRVIVPAVVAAQAVRAPAKQAKLMRVLHGAIIEPFTEEHHMVVGKLLAKSGTCDVVDAFVAFLAAANEAGVFTSDVDDIKHLVRTLGADLPVLAA
jgi:predicted nucleic acid-binding protein